MKIIVLPGLDGSGALHAQFVASFAATSEIEVVSYPTELTQYSDLLNWLIPNLPREEFVVVAESFSGPLAIRLAAAQQLGLRGIVFVATFASAPIKLPTQLAEVLRFLPMKSKNFIKLAQPVLMGKWSTEAFSKEFHRALRVLPTKTIIERVKQVLQVDVTGNIHQIGVPYLYLSASHDRLIPKSAAAHFNLKPDRHISLDGPHFMLQANPKAAARAISDFVLSLSG